MFTSEVIAAFDYLLKDFGFEAKIINDHTVDFIGARFFVQVHYSNLQEISLHVGLLKERERHFGIEFVVALSSPEVAFSATDKFATTPGLLRELVAEKAGLLRKYGERVCKEDISVFTEMSELADAYRKNRAVSRIRYRAETAISQKKYAEALALYSGIGDSANRLDLKRIAYCRKKVGPD